MPTSVRLYLTYLANLAYLVYLTYLTYLVIVAKEVKIVKEVISCDVSPVAMFHPTLFTLCFVKLVVKAKPSVQSQIR